MSSRYLWNHDQFATKYQHRRLAVMANPAPPARTVFLFGANRIGKYRWQTAHPIRNPDPASGRETRPVQPLGRRLLLLGNFCTLFVVRINPIKNPFALMPASRSAGFRDTRIYTICAGA